MWCIVYSFVFVETFSLSGVKPAWSWYLICLVFVWILFARILLRNFSLMCSFPSCLFYRLRRDTMSKGTFRRKSLLGLTVSRIMSLWSVCRSTWEQVGHRVSRELAEILHLICKLDTEKMRLKCKWYWIWKPQRPIPEQSYKKQNQTKPNKTKQNKTISSTASRTFPLTSNKHSYMWVYGDHYHSKDHILLPIVHRILNIS